MEWHGHVASGTATGLAVAPLIPHPPTPGLVAIAGFTTLTAIAALIPDLDHPGSKLARSLGPVTWLAAQIIRRISHLVYEATRTPLDKPGRGGHRHLTHTAVFAVLAGLAVAAGVSPTGWGTPCGIAVALGCLTHTVGDMTTHYGCPIWWPIPLNGRRWSLLHATPAWLRFRTGGKIGERIATVIWTALAWGIGAWDIYAFAT